MASVALLLSGCGQEKEQVKQEEVLRTVRVMQAVSTSNVNIRSFSGIAKSNKEIKLSFKVQGNVIQNQLKVGDYIQKGDLVAKLDADTYVLKVQEAESVLQEGKANLRNAKNNYKRIQKLYINQNASQSELDKAKADFDLASASVERAKKQLNQAKLNLSYTKLYAPSNGYIAQKYVQSNENIAVGTAILLLSTDSNIEVEVQVPESFINKIALGSRVKVSLDSQPDKTYAAEVIKVAQVASTNQTYPVSAKLLKKDRAIKPGMASSVEFGFGNEESLFLVPSHAVLQDRLGKRFVYVINAAEENKAVVHKRVVTTGHLKENSIEVLTGLVDADLVITAGMSKMSEGMIVKMPKVKAKE